MPKSVFISLIGLVFTFNAYAHEFNDLSEVLVKTKKLTAGGTSSSDSCGVYAENREGLNTFYFVSRIGAEPIPLVDRNLKDFNKVYNSRNIKRVSESELFLVQPGLVPLPGYLIETNWVVSMDLNSYNLRSEIQNGFLLSERTKKEAKKMVNYLNEHCSF